jgi:hypothetical protein
MKNDLNGHNLDLNADEKENSLENLSKFQLFLLNLSSVDTDVIGKCTKQEVRKYIILGVILMLMWIINFFSFYHLLHCTGVSHIILLIFVSGIFSTLILFVEKFFISSTIINPNANNLERFRYSSIRLMLSFVISIAISIPAKLFFFEDKITNLHQKSVVKMIDSLRKQSFVNPEQKYLKNELQKRLESNEKKLAEYDHKINIMIEQLSHPTSMGIYKDKDGIWHRYYTKKGINIQTEIEQKKMERGFLSFEQKKLQHSLDSLSREMIAYANNFRQYTDSILKTSVNLNFIERYDYFCRITGNPFNIFNSFTFVSIIITLFFLIFDMGPVLMKSFFCKGLYEAYIYHRYIKSKLKLEYETYLKEQEFEKLKTEQDEQMKLLKMKQEEKIQKEQERKEHEMSMERMRFENERNLEKIKFQHETDMKNLEYEHQQNMKNNQLKHEESMQEYDLKEKRAIREAIVRDNVKEALNELNGITHELKNIFRNNFNGSIEHFKDNE